MTDRDALSARSDLRLNPVSSELTGQEKLVNNFMLNLQQCDAYEKKFGLELSGPWRWLLGSPGS